MAGTFRTRRWSARLAAALGIVAVLLGVSARVALAQIGSERYASIVIEAGSGDVLSAANPDEYRFPASLTKMMTLYMLFEALRDRRAALSQPVPVSPWAASMEPSKLGLVPGTTITVEQAILGLVTKSANDAAAALGEMMGGSEERFAQMMTLRARALGMTRTTFRNASGLPDWGQVTTARDLATLARHLIQDFPSYYSYFSVPSFVFGGRLVLNHQRLLQSYPGADGLKTGYIGASGFNVVTSAVRGETRLIGVVLGAASGAERDMHMASLLDQGFEQMGVPELVARHDAPGGFRLSGLIGTAQAAPLVTPQPRFYATARAARHGLRSAPAGLGGMHATTQRRALEGRSERLLRFRPIAAFGPQRSLFVAPQRVVARPREVKPLRPAGTRGRSVNRKAGRVPG